MDKIKIKYYDNDIKIINKFEKIKLGHWLDLYTAEEAYLSYGDYKPISLGISMRLPRGYEALVMPKSNSLEKYGIVMANSMTIIDSLRSDAAVWRFPALCLRIPLAGDVMDVMPIVHIPKCVKIAQLRITKIQPETEFLETEVLDDIKGVGFYECK